MRNIKLRAWDEEYKKMIAVFGFDLNHVIPFIPFTSEEINKTPIPVNREDAILM